MQYNSHIVHSIKITELLCLNVDMTNQGISEVNKTFLQHQILTRPNKLHILLTAKKKRPKANFQMCLNLGKFTDVKIMHLGEPKIHRTVLK